MTDRTMIVFNDDHHHEDLKMKALQLHISLSELLTKGGELYKPKKGLPKGMQLFMDTPSDLPEDFYNKKQWNKHINNSENKQKLKEQVLWLAGKLKI